MKLSLVIFTLFIVGIYGVDVTEIPTVNPTTDIPVAKHKTTTTITTTPTTTTQSTSTNPTTSSSTTSEASTSTSTSTPATTTKPTTTPTTPTTPTTTPTTPPPKPTPPTPKPKPTPVPEPEVGQWNVTEGNKTCILVEFASQLNVNYTTAGNTSASLIYNVPKTANATGSCGNGTTDQNIIIEWTEKNVPNTMSMTFKLNQTLKEFTLYKIAINLNGAILPDADNKTKFAFYHVGGVFETHTDKSWHCTRAQDVNLTKAENSTDVIGHVTISKVLMEAFHTGDNKNFSEAVDCDSINTPDIVPIAVGIALIALVVIVLIAYFVGRRRARNNGYVSM